MSGSRKKTGRKGRKERRRSRSSHRSASSDGGESDSASRSRSRSRTRESARRRSSSRSRSPDGAKLRLKLLGYVTRGKARRLRKLLRRHGARLDLAAPDAHGSTLLHQACACGHADVVAALVRAGAPAGARDALGDTPAHTAARAGALQALAEVLQAPGAPPVDAAGSGGATLRALMARALAGGAGAPSALVAAGRGGAGQAADEDGEEDEEEAWRRRLQEEYSDHEGGGGGGGGGRGGWDDDVSSYWMGAGGETDDQWAGRLWRDMQRRRAAAASAASASFAAGLRAEAARRAAAEAQERSRQILQEEQAKDAEWRRRTTLAIEAGPSSEPPLDLAAARAWYDSRWAQLESAGSASAVQTLSYHDVPWPLEPPPASASTSASAAAGPGPAAAGGRTLGPAKPAPHAPPPAPSVDALRDFLLLGAESGPADVKRRLRAELLRWHPDKFGARLGPALARAGEAHRAVALARVHQLAQVLTRVLAGG
ncbi:hypothetical protein HYH03_016406 [Edaphochlamys debaryana]|uniref:NF-kappa-B inhibitor-like protein 1 n=1 Tax=Edaphochlamys debaryana TaxID=47281 RepID=A0A836BQ75_9CHLO|nr:hypothetical protein HYH03_016406 [Edaphochlamys debaryana]|eukprot:KAG2484840.1 hypothetical protein HYH03_016406 [Edaphochlamys debaryana]